jgi:diguanylate cyclase (GGDEF)-like protein
MRTRRSKRVRARSAVFRAWPMLGLPRWLVGFIVMVTACYIVAVAVALAHLRASPRDFLLFAALLLCTAATVELTRRSGENAGVIKDVYAVWELPLAILLPLAYVLMAPAFRLALQQWRIRRIPVHRRVFSASVVGLSYMGAAYVFHAVTGLGFGTSTLPRANATGWLLAVAVASAIQWGLNTTLLFPAIKGSDPTVGLRRYLLAQESVQNDVAELCVAVLVTLGVAFTPLTVAFAFPFVTLLQRSSRHAHLVNQSRLDTKTGLLNAGTWEREAASEVARAVRTRSPLAVAIIDVDHFKAVNDAYGHLAGDKALQALARTLREFLREYDLVGRFGGEEFVLLLPQTKAVDAYRIAERIRAHVRSMPIEVGGDNGAEQVRLTVSIGVAALGAAWDTSTGGQITDLLAAADGALYRAKQDGRDQVCVITENATFSVLAHAPSSPYPNPSSVSEPRPAAVSEPKRPPTAEPGPAAVSDPKGTEPSPVVAQPTSATITQLPVGSPPKRQTPPTPPAQGGSSAEAPVLSSAETRGFCS